MADSRALSYAFLQNHPVEAARVLEQLPPPEAAALFAEVPARLAAPVLLAMLPHAAARCLGLLEADAAVLILGALNAAAATALLRQAETTRRAQLLEGLPTSQALACRALLAYADDTVGAWVDVEILSLQPERVAREALDALRSHTGAVSSVFLVTPGQRLLGRVSPGSLLRAAADSRLETLAEPVQVSLPAVMPLAAAQELDAWNDNVWLPAVERGERLIGVLHRRVLRDALAGRRGRPPAERPSLGAALALGYWTEVSRLIEATISLLPARKGRT